MYIQITTHTYKNQAASNSKKSVHQYVYIFNACIYTYQCTNAYMYRKSCNIKNLDKTYQNTIVHMSLINLVNQKIVLRYNTPFSQTKQYKLDQHTYIHTHIYIYIYIKIPLPKVRTKQQYYISTQLKTLIYISTMINLLSHFHKNIQYYITLKRRRFITKKIRPSTLLTQYECKIIYQYLTCTFNVNIMLIDNIIQIILIPINHTYFLLIRSTTIINKYNQYFISFMRKSKEDCLFRVVSNNCRFLLK
eukprot:TRINITY_DN9312_c1_g1_i1.p2 TRINITY_DN9312_c1_g1~~TRINITY_DN9312_c1_g1_i1.p2  ORF type:complete len:248 (-),score=-42.86 TRINITY_DN9312_c1_g1_i1:218-961(-)